jgi:hypothetical protein
MEGLIGKIALVGGWHKVLIEEVSAEGECGGYDSDGEWFGFFEDEIDAFC